MYKIDYSEEKIALKICEIVPIIGTLFWIIFAAKNLKYTLIWILIILMDMIVILAIKKSIEDKEWLSQNGKIVRNLPFKSEKLYDDISIKRRGIIIKVKYKVSHNKEVEFTKTFSKFEKVPDQAIDLLYDENNPEYRYYLGFDIEEIKE